MGTFLIHYLLAIQEPLKELQKEIPTNKLCLIAPKAPYSAPQVLIQISSALAAA